MVQPSPAPANVSDGGLTGPSKSLMCLRVRLDRTHLVLMVSGCDGVCGRGLEVCSHAWRAGRGDSACFVLRMRRRCPLLPRLRSFRVPPLQDAIRRMDEEVWAFLANFSGGPARPPPSSSKTSSSSSSSSRRLGPPSPLSGSSSSSVRASRPRPSSPGRPPRLQVPPEGAGVPQGLISGSR